MENQEQLLHEVADRFEELQLPEQVEAAVTVALLKGYVIAIYGCAVTAFPPTYPAADFFKIATRHKL